VTCFRPIWVAMAMGAAACSTWMVGRAAAPILEKTGNSPHGITSARRRVWSRGAIAAITLLGLSLLGEIVLTLTWEDFAYSDNDMFTLSTLKGEDLAPPMWNAQGRFFPLGHQEFNLIRHFTVTVAGYQALPIVQLLILCGILLILDDDLSMTARAALTAFIVITPGIVISFGGLIFTERNLVFWMIGLVLFLKRFEETQSPLWAAAAALSAQIMIYYKETAFLLLLGFAVGRLVLRCKSKEPWGWDLNRLRDRESRLDLCLASLGVLFFLYYMVVMFPHPNMTYATNGRLPVAQIVLSYIKLDLLAWLLVAAVLGRAYLILRCKATAWPLWDGLAFGGVVFFTSYLYLQIFTAYFLGPVDVIATLYLGRLAIFSWAKTPLQAKVTEVILLFIVLIQCLSLSALSVFERKNLIHSKAQIADFVQARYRTGTGSVRRVFLPFADPYRVMEFASYLSYRGVPIEGAAAEPPGPNSVVVVSAFIAKDGPCVEWRNIMCQAAQSPNPGDLVIFLRDDDVSTADVAAYIERGDLLLSYVPRPHIPKWLYPCVRDLHIASTPFPEKGLPEHWLHASVTLWR